MANRLKLTPEKKEQFLGLLRQKPIVTAAARAIGMATRSLYDARERNPKFAQDWDDAIAEGVEALEELAFDRIQTFKNDTKMSDALLIFLLKAHNPRKYADFQRTEHSGIIEVRSAKELSDDELAAIASNSGK